MQSPNIVSIYLRNAQRYTETQGALSTIYWHINKKSHMACNL